MVHTALRAGLALLFVAAVAAGTTAPTQAQEIASGKRVALVIGNSTYRNVTGLINPVNDATDIAAKLKSLQFDVLLGTDVDHAKMSALIEQFKAKVTREHVALLFYAGHGVAVNRESFLLPIDTPDAIEVDDKGELRGDAANRAMISMASVLEPLEASRIGIVFLDACRNSSADAGLGMTARTVSLGKVKSVKPARETFFYYSGKNPSAVRYKNWKMYFAIAPETATGWNVPGVQTQFAAGMVNIKRDPFETGIGEWKKAGFWFGGAIAAPATAYIYDWNLLPIGQNLWLKELETYKKFPPLQDPASYNLEQVMEEVKKVPTHASQ